MRNRGEYSNPGAAFMYTSGEPGSGMDCLQLRQPPGPFHYLISEQAKSLVALQELQHEVGALLQFRDIVIDTFPDLRIKMASSNPSTMTSHASNIPVAVRRDWEPGVRVRRKLASKDESRTKKGQGETTIQDSGFSTETSSKEIHSASSSAITTNPAGNGDESEDELFHLLDIIHRKGTRLKDEVEALQGTLREQRPEEDDFQRVLLHSSVDDVRQLRRERDLLLDRVAEMEAEVLAGRAHTTRLQEDLVNLLAAKHDLEEQLKSVVSQRGEVNSRIHDLHLQFVSKSPSNSPETDKPRSRESSSKRDFSSQKTTPTRSRNGLDRVLGDALPKVKTPESSKVAAILKEHDPLVLQKHLLTSTVQNQVLREQLDSAARLEVGLVDKLDKAREENEELRFQLEDKNIELEGTRARVRLLEQLQKPSSGGPSPDVVPALDPGERLSRSEITTSSMKNMSPLPMNLTLDHSSSTESAHDQSEAQRKGEARRRPSKIPLVKGYAAPKPPGGKHSPAPGARSRSGESLGRPHSAQSWRNKSEGSSLSGSKSGGSLGKGRNPSLGATKDSLSKTRESPAALGSGRGTLRKTSTPVRRTNSIREAPDAKMASDSRRKFQSQWILSSYSSVDCEQLYLDSLDHHNHESLPPVTIETSSAQAFETANNFLWNVGGEARQHYYDSIDSTLESSLYQNNGDLAECDSLEKQFGSTQHKK